MEGNELSVAGGRPARLGPPWGRGWDAGTGSPGTACHAPQEALGFRKGLPRSRFPNCLARWADQNQTGSGNPVLRLRVQDSQQDPLAKVPMAPSRERGAGEFQLSTNALGARGRGSTGKTPMGRDASACTGSRRAGGSARRPWAARVGCSRGLFAWAVCVGRERSRALEPELVRPASRRQRPRASPKAPSPKAMRRLNRLAGSDLSSELLSSPARTQGADLTLALRGQAAAGAELGGVFAPQAESARAAAARFQARLSGSPSCASCCTRL